MSRDPTPSSVTLRRFPRVSGDEPVWYIRSIRKTPFPRVSGDEPSPVHRLNVRRVFSPRERG